jgi:hypothetical protein
MDGEGVDAGLELAGKGLIDHAMAGEPALPLERISHDIYAEMSLPARPMSCMAFVLMGFIEHLQAHGSEGLGQFPRNRFLHAHHDTHARSINGGFTMASIGIPAQARDMSREVCQACALR